MIIDDIKLNNTDNSPKVDIKKICPKIYPYFDQSQYKQIIKFMDILDSLNVDYDIKDKFFSCILEAYKLGKMDQERYRCYLDSKNH